MPMGSDTVLNVGLNERGSVQLMKDSNTSTIDQSWESDLQLVTDGPAQASGEATRIFEIGSDKLIDERLRSTKDIFTEAQKVAYVGLCAVTSAEVVHDFQGADSTYARMSAGNWQRNLMKLLYIHMDISLEEIRMIETLAAHNINPSSLVHQFVAQGETRTVFMKELTDSKVGSAPDSFAMELDSQNAIHGEVVVDLRWTVMCDLFLLCLDSENYDARSRVFILRVASYLSLDRLKVMDFEKRVTEHLLQNDTTWETDTLTSAMPTQNSTIDIELLNLYERQSHSKRRKKKRLVMIGIATLGGGLILGLSAGFMAPVIAGGLGAVLTTAGVSGASGFLTGSAGVGLITSAATMAGVRLGAKSMNRRMKSVNTFEFLPVQVNSHVSCIVSITGWLTRSGKKDEAALPFSVLEPIMGDHYALYWEPELLEELGSAFKIFATEAVSFSIQQALAHTIMGALLAGLTMPLALTKLGYLIDNPWANALDRSRLAGLILADALMNRNLGARPVTLVGFSLGARVIFYCLLELSRVNAHGLVENVALFGTPVSSSQAQWKKCTTVVAGRFINGYATNDWLLGFLFRASVGGLGNVAGLHPLENVDSKLVENLDCTDLVNGHLSYRTAMPRLLKRAGFGVASEEVPELSAEETITKCSDHKHQPAPLQAAAVNTKGNALSSLHSGTASIHLPAANDQQFTPNSSKTEANGKRLSLQSPFRHRHNSPPKTISDIDILSSIITNASAATPKTGSYSSLSCGRASISSSQSNAVTKEIPNATKVPNVVKRSNTVPASKASLLKLFSRTNRANDGDDRENAGIQK